MSLASKEKVWLDGAHLQPQWGVRDRGIPRGLMASQATLINEPRVPKQNKQSEQNKMNKSNAPVFLLLNSPVTTITHHDRDKL